MNRIPPSLLYLTIYNPTLRPIGVILDDDEDAEEQAHILFYTSKERAVSRDRMLRQVGLAKALVNFSEIFNANDACSSVHSQSRRMIMVSPEPDFWIHAGIEVAKSPQISSGTIKGKKKDRMKDKTKFGGTNKEKEKEVEPAFDFEEGSVHDLALQQDLLRGYERFKLTHGSFTSILSMLGQQALELQLERFFTVWAWTWDLEDRHDFKDHLGVPLHPNFRSLIPALDKHSFNLPKGSASIVICPPYIIPSSAYIAAEYPQALSRYLLSLAPPVQESIPSVPASAFDGTIKKRSPESNGKDPPTEPPANTFLGIPAVNMNVNKWDWSGYLTFGRGATKRPVIEESKETYQDGPLESPNVCTAVQVDIGALDDAISSDGVSVLSADLTQDAPPNIINNTIQKPLETPPGEAQAAEETKGEKLSIEHLSKAPHIPPPDDADSASLAPSTCSNPDTSSCHLSSTSVYISNPENPLLTLQTKVSYITKVQIMLCLIGPENRSDTGPILDPHSIGMDVTATFEDLEAVLLSEMSQSTDTLPSAAKILQPTDSHVATVGHFTVSTPGFASASGHLYNAQEIQASDSDISEVFSRGQNPQHWHIARRGLGYNDEGITIPGDVYMEVFRKEASLADVDNGLAGVVRKCGLAELEDRY